jgi:hypothetical protein
MGYYSKDDDFFYAQFFAFHVKKMPKKYLKMEDYLLHHKFPFKSHTYIIFGDYI